MGQYSLMRGVSIHGSVLTGGRGQYSWLSTHRWAGSVHTVGEVSTH